MERPPLVVQMPWDKFVHEAMLEIKNGWPLLPTDKVSFKDQDGNEFAILPHHVEITLTKKV